jgi:chemotaxis protein MotB
VGVRGQRQGNGRRAGIVIRREEETSEPHHGGSWKIAYADFVTAMMAFFLLMWLINATTEAQRKGLANYFAPSNQFSLRESGAGKPFGGRTPFSNGMMVSDTGAMQVITGPAEPEPNAIPDPTSRVPGMIPPERARQSPIHPGPATIAASEGAERSTPPAPPAGKAAGAMASAKGAAAGPAGPDIGAPAMKPAGPPAARPDEAAQEQATQQATQQAAFARAAEAVRDALGRDKALAGMANQVAIDVTPQGLRIQIMDAKHRPMFALGSAEPTKPAREFLAKLAPILGRIAGSIEISGYTDAAPYRQGGPVAAQGTGRGTGQATAMSNWDLSAERANATRAALVGDGLAEARIARVAGYADRDLLLPADPLAAENRRIAILVTRPR